KLDGLRLYFDAGTQDRYQFGKSNAMLHDVLAEKKIEHTWTLVEGGGHAWGSGFQPESLLASLTFVGDGFKAKSDKGKPAAGHAEAGNGKGDGKDGAAAAPGTGKAAGKPQGGR